ncbi:phosphopantetheine-binding protein [Kitasatospora purpeofusca]|uniref:phosphopantetheine-binding protein n=1 Tax=Kitasatospora purpeofusca TaxID=67352 RepID=UPI0036D2D30D
MSEHRDMAWAAEFEQVWMEVLGVDAVDQDDDFFDLGGHSLSALRLSMLARQELGLAVELNHVLENPRFGDLLAVAAKAGPERVAEGGRA